LIRIKIDGFFTKFHKNWEKNVIHEMRALAHPHRGGGRGVFLSLTKMVYSPNEMVGANISVLSPTLPPLDDSERSFSEKPLRGLRLRGTSGRSL